MKNNFDIYECESSNEWNGFVNQFGTIHHLFEWKYINQESFGCRCVNLVCCRGSTIIAIYPYIIRGKWPIKWYVSPNDFGGGPIGDLEGIKALIREVEQRAIKDRIIMNTIRYGNENVLSPFTNYEVIKRKNLVIDLNRPEKEIWASLKNKIRNSIRKSGKQGIVVEEGNMDNLNEYIKLVKKHSSSLGYRPRDEKFIKSIFRYLNATMLIAKWKGVMVGGCIYLIFNKRAYAINAARDPEKPELRIGEALHWAGIKYFKEKDFREYDFMSRNDNYWNGNEFFVSKSLTNLHRFKLGWRPKEEINYDLNIIYSKAGLNLRKYLANIRNRILIFKTKFI